MYSKYTTPLLSSSHCAHCHLHLVVVALWWHSPCALHHRHGDVVAILVVIIIVPVVPPHCPHPPHGAGWWWWGRRRHCAPHCHSCPRRHLIVVPVPLAIVPLVIVDMSPWHWPWSSRHRHHCVNTGRVVGSPSIVLSLLLCPLLSLSLPSPSSLLSRCCPPRLPPVVVVRDR